MTKIKAEILSAKVADIFVAGGVPRSKAARVAKMLVDGNLSGHDSHGVIRVRQYLNQIQSGLINPNAEPSMDVDLPSYALVNGNRGFGQITATFAIEKAIDKSNENGFAIVGCKNMSHVGRLGDYVSIAAEQGFMALAFCNGGGPNVAPFGSKDRVFGTNPIACAVPLNEGRHLEIDFASASTAEGKIQVAKLKGQNIDKGFVISGQGKMTKIPEDFYQGGAILPIGEHKGSALSLLLEIMGGIYTGAGCSSFDGYLDGNGLLFFASKPDLFRSSDAFLRDIHLLMEKAAGSSKADGVEKILLPGQKEDESRERLMKDGIVLDDNVLKILSDAAESVDVQFSI